MECGVMITPGRGFDIFGTPGEDVLLSEIIRTYNPGPRGAICIDGKEVSWRELETTVVQHNQEVWMIGKTKGSGGSLTWNGRHHKDAETEFNKILRKHDIRMFDITLEKIMGR